VINASLVGVVEACRLHSKITGLYGACRGITGILEEKFLDLFSQDEAILRAVSETPSSALGSDRQVVTDAGLERLLDVFRAHNVRYFFYAGGNGSMGTAQRISSFARDRGHELCVIGIPKTIDNDLLETDHSPGYPSTARFFACAMRDVGADNRALPTPVSVVEVMGRNVGWLVAATSLARQEADDAPHLIYFPERRLAIEQLFEDVQAVYRRLGRAVIAVCEGQLDENGQPFGADVRTGSRHRLALNLGHALSQIISRRLKIQARSEKPGLVGRSNMALVSPVDRAEARECGRAAVEAAMAGVSGKMVTLVRDPGPVYRVRTGLVDLECVADRERRFPHEWMNSAGNNVLPAFREYAIPLVGEIPSHARLRQVFVAPRLKPSGPCTEPRDD
jgi:6-phosphofructokinase 1